MAKFQFRQKGSIVFNDWADTEGTYRSIKQCYRLFPASKGWEFRVKTEAVESSGSRAADWLRQVADRLIEKSKSYGDSVGDPIRIFSSSGKTEGIRVRIDDKLSRIARGKEWPGEDVIVDLVGYLALLAVTEDKK